MNASLSFITRTALVSDVTGDMAGLGPRELEVLGYDPASQRVYFLEHAPTEADTLPQLFAMGAHGWLAGRTTPVHSLYIDDPDASTLAARLNALRQRLIPLRAADSNLFRMSTRVTKRRAVRIEPGIAPVRRYDLRVTVRPIAEGKVIPMGARKTVTAYLQPRVRLVGLFVHPDQSFAIAVVSYIGVPFQLGHDRQSAIYLPLPRR